MLLVIYLVRDDIKSRLHHLEQILDLITLKGQLLAAHNEVRERLAHEDAVCESESTFARETVLDRGALKGKGAV